MATILHENNTTHHYHHDNNRLVITRKRKQHRFTVSVSIQGGGVHKTTFEIDSHYTPIHGVGTGTYGVVCSCHDTRTNQKVAIKKITNIFDDEVVAMCALREMKILGHVRHENVISLKDVMDSSSEKMTFSDVYLVYELMDTDLGNIIRSDQRLSDDHVKFFVLQVLRGVDYLHSSNIIHRDLKPANLLVNANCDLKICDFRLARTNNNRYGKSKSMTEYVVTRWYRAPELLYGCDTYGPSIDVWAVGCVFAELLCRKPMFAGKNEKDQLERIVNVIGTPDDSELGFLRSMRMYNYLNSLPYSSGQTRLRLFDGADPMAVDLLWKMLVFDPRKRVMVSEALKHPYFSGLVESDQVMGRPGPSPYDVNMDGGIGSDKIRNLIWNKMLLYHPDPSCC